MPDEGLAITPSTRIAQLLDHYPQIEDVLIGYAPPFRKRKNPILRRSVASVASVRQAAAVARVPVGDLVDLLRAAVGQAPLAGGDDGGTASCFGERPDWFDPANIGGSTNEQEGRDDEMTLNRLSRRAVDLKEGEILELRTTFLPAPGIDIMKRKGFPVWTVEEEPESVRTYFRRPPGGRRTGSPLRPLPGG